MNKTTVPKLILVTIWCLFAASFIIVFPSPMGITLKVLGGTLIVAHVFEFIIYKQIIKAKRDGGVKSFLMTMIFGLLYVKARP